ncbi:sulfite exporter TauE/SafE family protein [Paenibacillus humicola]|uniref:sulfite exporter TauE/SafE family protein n=1 Tax=Paenibacillus humicola TaxID=3110540 RepID=UPI00237A38BF|nr:sulfite exporter TauE/SafE family protein [Paenibacillus humicola]
MQVVLAVLSGITVGFTLGLLGGGGSILAVPLLLYVVGVRNPHIVIGSTALAVAINAYMNLILHAKKKHVKWKIAVSFALPGTFGAYGGSIIGKLVPAKQLLFLFAVLMIVLALRMIMPKKGAGEKNLSSSSSLNLVFVIAVGILVGFLSGFFGIGGGFLIVPGLMYSAGLPIVEAIGTSLFSVGTFGLTTAVSYSISGLVNWWIAIEYIAGGIVGGLIGTALASRWSEKRKTLQYIFTGVVLVVAVYMLILNAQALHL